MKASIVDAADDVALQEHLFNLLGVSGFEIMGEIMQNVAAVRAAVIAEGGGGDHPAAVAESAGKRSGTPMMRHLLLGGTAWVTSPTLQLPVPGCVTKG